MVWLTISPAEKPSFSIIGSAEGEADGRGSTFYCLSLEVTHSPSPGLSQTRRLTVPDHKQGSWRVSHVARMEERTVLVSARHASHHTC